MRATLLYPPPQARVGAGLPRVKPSQALPRLSEAKWPEHGPNSVFTVLSKLPYLSATAPAFAAQLRLGEIVPGAFLSLEIDRG